MSLSLQRGHSFFGVAVVVVLGAEVVEVVAVAFLGKLKASPNLFNGMSGGFSIPILFTSEGFSNSLLGKAEILLAAD